MSLGNTNKVQINLIVYDDVIKERSGKYDKFLSVKVTTELIRDTNLAETILRDIHNLIKLNSNGFEKPF